MGDNCHYIKMSQRKLVLFNRQLNVASDDFVFGGLLESCVRTVGLLVLVLEFGRYIHDMESCSTGHLIHTYLTGLIVFFILTIIQDMIIVRISMKGTILDDRGRRNISTFLYVRIAILLSEFVWSILGTASILLHISDSSDCGSWPRVYWLACLAVAGGWITSILQTVFILLTFEFQPKEHQAVIAKHDWEKRWKNVCCCLNADENKHVFSTLSQLCTRLFKKEELVGSDIMAGLILVYNKQHGTRQQLDVVDAPLLPTRFRCKPHKVAVSPSVARKPWMNTHEAAHYMKFALGSYGWFYYIGLNNPVWALSKLLPRLNWGMKAPPLQIDKDGGLLANTVAFMLQTGVKIGDIVCASFHNEIYAIPFYVTVDRESKSVIVSVRGTLSLEDILTDLVVERAPVCFEGIHGLVHTGMYQSAKYIRNRLVTDGILQTAFSKNPDYRLVITGHSLGGGVAALLAMELWPLYKNNLICFAFAAPGELVSGRLIPYTEEFICTVALGYDVVPRLGLVEVIQLRIDILNAVRECNLPKHQILAHGIWTRIFGKVDLSSHTHPVETDQTRWFDKYIDLEKEEKDRFLSSYEPLLPPGQILHVLEKHDENRPWNVAPEYYAEWTDCQTFREIVLSKRMIAHHFPDTLLEALRQLAQHGHDDPKKDL